MAAPLYLAAHCCPSERLYDPQAVLAYGHQALLKIRASVVNFLVRASGQNFLQRSPLAQHMVGVRARPYSYRRTNQARRRSKRAGALEKLNNLTHAR